MRSFLLLLFTWSSAVWEAGAAAVAKPEVKVTFDNRAFVINGKRTLFVAGSIHYPRASSTEWPAIIESAKDNGINLIQIYVFWDIHEPEEGVFHFPRDGSSADLVGFLRDCEAADIYVNLRFGPYVCAEWNYGGFPQWLRQKEGVIFRTMNDIFLEKMALFIDKTLEVVTDARLMAQDGGPVVMLQIENEYGNMEQYYPHSGAKYVQWAAQFALNKNLSVPWMMCQQGEGVGTAPPKEIINTCNGYYCDNWIAQHSEDFPSQPHMWTENWPGWYQKWGEAVPHRPAVDVTFGVARFFAKGGSYMNYYMVFGGTSFGRDVGGPLIVTSYDYDVQINEYGLAAEPKYSLTQKLHRVLHSSAPVLLAHDQVPPAVPLASSSSCESHAYDQHPDVGCVSFLSNWGTGDDCVFVFDISGKKGEGEGASTVSFTVPAWSVSILADTCASTSSSSSPPSLLFNTKTDADQVPTTHQTPVAIPDLLITPFELLLSEPIPSSSSASHDKEEEKEKSVVISSSEVLDQLVLTNDETDYLWTSASFQREQAGAAANLSFSISTDGGPVLYVFVNGQLVASSIDEDSAVTGMLQRMKEQEKQSASVQFIASVETMQFSLTGLQAGTNSVDILFSSMGLKNYGPYLERVRVGIVSDLLIDGSPLAEYKYTVGLSGERHELAKFPTATLPPATTATSTTGAPVWFRASFATTPALARSPPPALALDFSASRGAKKGAVWVNGFMLGRYWDIVASEPDTDKEQCSSEAYTGPYLDSRCRTGGGERSQSLYKIPTGLLHPVDSAEPNVILVLDEFGASPEGVTIKEIVMM